MHSLFSRCVQMSRRSRFLKRGEGGIRRRDGLRGGGLCGGGSLRCLGRGRGGMMG